MIRIHYMRQRTRHRVTASWEISRSAFARALVGPLRRWKRGVRWGKTSDGMVRISARRADRETET